MILSDSKLISYVDAFNARDEETVAASNPNEKALEWMTARIPRMECPDGDIESTYYFRWWTYRKHVKDTPEGRVITEFLPKVNWSGRYNTISCAAGHHLYEGRWLRDPAPLFEYARFWYRGGGALHAYSNWLPEALYRLCLTTSNFEPAVDLLDDLVADEAVWEREHLHSSGLYWSNDNRDGGEYSISGPGLRTTLNCYRWASMRAIAAIADKAGKVDIRECFIERAERLAALICERLWDEKSGFFRCIPLDDRTSEVPSWSFSRMDRARIVRELWGYLPWYFGMSDMRFECAWKSLFQPEGFHGEYGPTTAERSHPHYGIFYTGEELRKFMTARTGTDSGVGPKGHECLWNGPSWPYATAQTLTALANHLCGDPRAVDREEYARLLARYARSQRLVKPDGTVVPWIDENLHPDTGDWISRTRLMSWSKGGWDEAKGGYERGKDYNHSTYCDNVISGLFGVRPGDGCVEINPLLPADWDWACLDGVPCHGRLITVLWDRTGAKYGRGSGFHVFADHMEKVSMQQTGACSISI